MTYTIRPNRRPLAPITLLAAAGMLALAGTSCGPQNSSPPAVREDSIDVPDAAPDDLLAMAHEASAEASRLADRLTARHFPPNAPNELRTQLFTGIKAADKLLADPAADETRRQAAAQLKLDLLKIGVGRRLIPFGRLETYAGRLIEQSPRSELAAAAEAALLEVDRLAGDPPPEQVAEALFEFAQNHPNSKAGVDLTSRMAEKLASDGNRKQAIQLYQIAIALYADCPEVESLETRLAELSEAEAAATAARSQQAQLAASQMTALRRQFGGHSDGYFVVYAEENVKPPRHGGMYFYRYEYEVLKGLVAAASYAEALPEKWSWQLVQRFPETAQGREQAYELWRDLLRKKKTGKS